MKTITLFTPERKRNSNRSLHIPGLLILIILLISSAQKLNGKNQSSLDSGADTLYSVKQLNEDFTVLLEALEEGHPGLYRYAPAKIFDKLFAKTKQSLDKPMSEIDFFLKLDTLIAGIHCGHTRIGLSSTLNSHINNSRITIPFSFKFINNKTYLLNNYSEKKDLITGGEVISINGNSIGSIIRKMLPLISSDASILTYKYRYLEKANNFSRLYALLYGIDTSFTIIYSSPVNSKPDTLKVKGISKTTMLKIAETRYPGQYAESLPVSLTYKNDTAILTVRTFNSSIYAESKVDYENFLKEAFNEFREKNIKNLIVDLRNNDGGDDIYGKILASYFFDKPFYYYNSLEFKDTSYNFLKYTNISNEDWTAQTKTSRKNSNNLYDYTDHPNLGKQENLSPGFQGKVYILINGNSFSTTGEVVSVLHYNKKAEFMGEECGAAYYGSNSGFIAVLTLPNTKMRISIPLLKYTMAVDNYDKNHGVIPDIPFSPDIKEIVEGKDPEMEYLLNLINNMK